MYRASDQLRFYVFALCFGVLLPVHHAPAAGPEIQPVQALSSTVEEVMQTPTIITHEPVPLLAVMRENQVLFWDVVSTGCTKAADFGWKLETGSTNATIVIYRLNPDRCRKLPSRKRFKLKLPATIDQIVVQNPLVDASLLHKNRH